MIYGLSGKPVPASFPFAGIINQVGATFGIPPCFIAAIAQRETLSIMPAEEAMTFVSSDGGRGVMQLTSEYPATWADPSANIVFACQVFIKPDLRWLAREQLTGDALVKVAADAYNEGLLTAWGYHLKGDADAGSTNDYGAGVLAIWHTLLTQGES